MPWAQWDAENQRLLATVNELPEAIRGLPEEQLANMGYRQMYIEYPEDFIQRFSPLVGSAQFDIQPDGRLRQYYPNADFSVAAVRKFLLEEVDRDALRIFHATDWCYIRKMETGEEIPEDVVTLRQRQRDHMKWIKEQIQNIPERELVDYRWAWPTSIEHIIVNGIPVTTQTPVPDTPPLITHPVIGGPARPLDPNPEPNPEQRIDPVTGWDWKNGPPADQLDQYSDQGLVFGLPQPTYVPIDPATIPVPPTTDGPVEHRIEPLIEESQPMAAADLQDRTTAVDNQPREVRS